MIEEQILKLKTIQESYDILADAMLTLAKQGDNPEQLKFNLLEL